MKKSLLFFLLSIMVNCVHAQRKEQEYVDPGVYEVRAEFPGGDKAMKEFIKKNFRYPLSGKDLEFKMWIKIEIDEKGNVSNATIKKGYNKKYDDEAIRVLNKMPKWSPSTYAGKPQKCKMIIPIFSNRM
ncbi:MAG TPA: energy transducer TonB [Flavobacteriales bacterium]|nr:energy transducer TonB [Flavobacteriales bacterium]